MRRLRGLCRLARHLAIRAAWVPLAGLLGHLRSPRQIIEDFAGDQPAGSDRVALFVHYDGRGEVRPHVAAYLAALRDSGCAIVFVTNAGRLTQAARATLAPLCARVLIRRNVGYDFGAWRDALERCGYLTPGDAAGPALLLLVNDSVYGPIGPLAPVLAGLDPASADLWGLTETWQGRYHLQSFFLAATSRAYRSPAWARFWATVRPAPSKTAVILRYEIGLTQAMLRAGLRVRARFPYADLVATAAARPRAARRRARFPYADLVATAAARPRAARRAEVADAAELIRDDHRTRILNDAARRTPLNPTSDFWRELLLAGCPFVKRELLRDNPTGVPDVADLLPKLREAGHDTSLIDLDLRRVLRRTAP